MLHTWIRAAGTLHCDCNTVTILFQMLNLTIYFWKQRLCLTLPGTQHRVPGLYSVFKNSCWISYLHMKQTALWGREELFHPTLLPNTPVHYTIIGLCMFIIVSLKMSTIPGTSYKFKTMHIQIESYMEHEEEADTSTEKFYQHRRITGKEIISALL